MLSVLVIVADWPLIQGDRGVHLSFFSAPFEASVHSPLSFRLDLRVRELAITLDLFLAKFESVH